MNPSLKDQLKDWKKLHQEPTPKKKKPHQKPQKRKSEHLTELDIKSLMGMNMPTYRRHKGALRQK
jgi:predicted Zn-dependent peptidase